MLEKSIYTIEKIDDIELLKKEMNNIYELHDKENGVNDIGFKNFEYVVKNNEGKIIGGVHGWRVFCEIYVDELCISKEMRGNGIGKELLKTIETNINDGNCDNMNLVTNNFQNAIEFYKKCGFEVEFVRKNSKNSKFDKYYMIKKLNVI